MANSLQMQLQLIKTEYNWACSKCQIVKKKHDLLIQRGSAKRRVNEVLEIQEYEDGSTLRDLPKV